MKLFFDKFVVFVPRGQFKLLKRQNKKKTYVVQSPGDDFSLFRKIKRKFRRTPHTNTYFFEGFYKAATTSCVGQRYNLGAGKPKKIIYLANLIGGEIIHLPDRPGEPKCTYADITKIQNQE